MENKTKRSRRTLITGLLTSIIAVFLVAIIVFANLLVSVLPVEYVKYDTTSDGIFSVGDTTRQLLETVKDPVEIYHIYEEGQEDQRISDFLERYTSINENIKVSHVDPAVNPTFTQQFTTEQLYNNSLIVSSEKRNTIVYDVDMIKYYAEGQYMDYETFYQYYTYMTQYYGTTPQFSEYFFAEQEITSAIDYVISDTIPVMYYTAKHGEAAINASVLSVIGNENIELKELVLSQGETMAIPEDAEAVIINSPTIDFTEAEAKLLSDYMTAGGNVILMTNYSTDMNTKLPNLKKLVNGLGVSSVDGLIIEEDAEHYMQYPYNTIPDINADSIPAKSMKSTNVSVYMTFAHGITVAEDAPFVVTPILTTSEKTYIKPTGATVATKEEGDPAGQFHTGVHVSLVGSDVESTVKDAGSFVWYSSADMVDPNFINAGNGDLFIATLSNMCDKQSTISIIGKALDVPFLEIDGFTSIVWLIVLVVVAPSVVIVTGFVIWFVRRRK